MSKLNPLQTAVYTLVKQFVQRQTIVLEAMRDLRPDLIIRTYGLPFEGTQEEWVALVRSLQLPPGYWGKNQEWAYRFHGMGCA